MTPFVLHSVVCCTEGVSTVSISHSFYGFVSIMYVDVIYMFICTHFYYYGSIYYNIMICIFYLLFSVLCE